MRVISPLHVCRPTPSYRELVRGSSQVPLSFFCEFHPARWDLISACWEIQACMWVLWPRTERPVFCGVRGTADWFGVSKDGDATQKWQRKSLRHCSLRYGKLKPQVIREMDLPSQDNISLTSTETPPPLYVPSSQHGMQKVKEDTWNLNLQILVLIILKLIFWDVKLAHRCIITSP